MKLKDIFKTPTTKLAEKVAAAVNTKSVGLIPQLLKYMSSKNLCKQHQAYILASIAFETGYTFLPVEEVKGYEMPYKPFYGRGLVQVTHKVNYEKLSLIYGVDLVNNRDLLLTDIHLNVSIAVDGMTQGFFTGTTLADYTDERGFNPVTARRVLNGNDKAEEIANLYNKILEVL